MNTAATITAVIEAAATRHCEPVEPITLLDGSLTFHRHNLRARLNALVAWRLHCHYNMRVVQIARAFNADWNTTYSRVRRGKILSCESPWKETYLQLP